MTADGEQTLLLCRAPAGRQWELGPVAELPFPHWLIGWPPAGRIDAIVPTVVRRVLTGALTSLAPLAFLASSASGGDKPFDGSSTLADLGRSIARRVGLASPSPACWRQEAAAKDAEAVFDQHGFDWALRAQLGLVCPAVSDLPTPSKEFVDAILGERWADQLPALVGRGVLAMLRPGVDGDVALLVAATPAVEARIADALDRTAAETGVRLITLDEPAFAERLAQRRLGIPS
ncbi:hypothetical protein [Aquabacterium sp.]|uniref:hypothetical protein n=1 Tax=Aquabacterium sp. TaxID=1872578 RepID=UPI003783DB47